MLIVGEKIDGTRKLFNKAVLARDVNFIQTLARTQVDAGADVLDINAGTNPEREPEDVIWLVNTVQEAVEKPLCLDSPNSAALLAGLTATKDETGAVRGLDRFCAKYNRAYRAKKDRSQASGETYLRSCPLSLQRTADLP